MSEQDTRVFVEVVRIVALLVFGGLVGYSVGSGLGQCAGFARAASEHCSAKGYPSWFVDEHRQIVCLIKGAQP